VSALAIVVVVLWAIVIALGVAAFLEAPSRRRWRRRRRPWWRQDT
jgi:hypothetical protein